MSMNQHRDVGVFHARFGLHNTMQVSPGPVPISDELLKFRIDFMMEEMQEFMEAAETMDHAGMLDALIDLVYVAQGTAHLFGYPWRESWDEVQRANMAKVRAQSDGGDSKRGSSFDVVKPEGWQAPDIARVLRVYNFDA